jgi:RNA polymerase sigma-70 factor, ECF subfamily
MSMSTSFEELEYVRSLRLGDHEVFAEMVREHHRSLLRHARQRVHDESSAEDVVQETFIRAFRAAPRLDDDSRIGPWLHAILTNVCIDEANRRKREVAKLDRMIGVSPDAGVSPSPEFELHLDEDHPELLSALASLPPSHREALTLRFLDGLDYDEVAATTGVSEENARARVSRARNAVRHALNGAAAIPVAIYMFFRRGRRAAAAFDRAEVAVPHAGAAHANRMATALAPAVDATNVIVTSSPVAAPLLGKAAAGAGMLALATLSIASEPETPRTAEAVVVTTIAAPVVDTTAPTAMAPVIVTAVAEPRIAPAPAVAVIETMPAAPTTVEAVTTSVTPPTTVPITTAPPTTAAPTTAPPTTISAVVSVGGWLSMSGSVVASGPRYDLGGSATLHVGDATSSGSVSGRIGIDPATDETGSQRLDGFISVALADGSVIELKLAGFAIANGDGGFSISGRFKASGAIGALISSGSFTGALGTGSLSLNLA